MTQLLGSLLFAPFFLEPTTYAAKVTNPQKPPKNAVLLSKVKSLTLRNGQKTSSRRVSAVPQLTCVGPTDVCKLYAVDVMRCTNEGADYDEQNIQWSCKASLSEDFKLGGTEVICEGYESSDDPFVLKGSCAVEYRLLLTDKGEERYGKQYRHSSDPYGDSNSPEEYAGYVFMAVFLAVLSFILYSIYKAWRSEPRRPGGGRLGGGSGGYGGGGGDDPPPPYDPHPPRKQANQPSQSWFNSGSQASSSRSNTRAQQEQGWRPGFWTGTAVGAATTYVVGGARNQTRNQPETTQRNTGGWFTGNGGGGQTSRRPQPPSSGSTSASSSTSYSNTVHESTGFGGTRRR